MTTLAFHLPNLVNAAVFFILAIVVAVGYVAWEFHVARFATEREATQWWWYRRTGVWLGFMDARLDDDQPISDTPIGDAALDAVLRGKS